MDMPGYLDLGKMMEMDPYAGFQARQQMDLARQFQNQKYQQEQNTTNKGTLENIFSAQNNPNKVQNQILQNEGLGLSNENLGYKNRTDKLGAERAEAMHQNNLNADQRAAALKMSDDDMKKFDYHVGELLRHPDPTQRAEGAKLQTYLSSYQAERRKAADAMALQQEQTRSHLGGINAQQEGQKNLEQMRIDAGKYDSKKFSLSIAQRIASAKTAEAKMEILEDAYHTALEQGDMAAANTYLERAKTAQLRDAERQRLKANAKSSLDMGELGVPQAAPLVPSAPIVPGDKPKKPLKDY